LTKPSETPGDASALLRRWVTIYGAVVAVLLLAVWDMTVKPGL
jgi:hypothetical protein